jgi:molybdenum cofactor synthesis domain-containing protein
MTLRAAVLVTSDRVSRGETEDVSGEIARELLAPIAQVVEKRVVPDEAGQIRDSLLGWCEQGVDIVVTVGGTGLSPRDVTAEATRSVIEKEARGIGTALIVKGLESTPRAMLSSAVAGVRGRTLIINLPGSRAAVKELLEYLRDVLPHAVEMIHAGGHG